MLSNSSFQVLLKINNNGKELIGPIYQSNIKLFIDEIVRKSNINNINTDKIVADVYNKLKEINTTSDIDEQIISSASELACEHYDYPKIAMYLLIRNLHLNTHSNYLDVVRALRINLDAEG